MNDPMASQPSISVVVVSDYEESRLKTWKEERSILEGLARQDIEEPIEVFLVENIKASESVPDSILGAFPNLKILFSKESESARLKDYGVSKTTGEYVAILEADCIPCREWLRVLADVLRNRPDISVVSGRTTYGQDNIFKRCLSLIDRGFDDLGAPGLTSQISNNGALYRRSVLEKIPYPDAATPFLSSRLRNQSIRHAGYLFFFEPRAVMQHAIGGWDFVRDFRRNTGYADMMSNKKIQRSEVPKLLFWRLKREASDCMRLGFRYLRWYDWPLTIVLLLLARALEVPGMFDAIYGRGRIPGSSYR